MSRILGLDLGSNSIGWSLIDDQKETIIDGGVRVFEEGVKLISGGKEESRNAKRREARQARRMHQRRSMRRETLKGKLQKLEMYPLKKEDEDEFYANDPYLIRAKGIKGKISLQEFGRALLHINKNRGFKSSRKTGANEKGALYKGSEGNIGITETAEEIVKGGFATLGEYLASIAPEKGRKRARYTLREMYEDEFESLWKKQREYHPVLRDDELKSEIRDIIFFQQKLKSQKSLVNFCNLENRKRTAPAGSPVFQRFRILKQLADLRITDIGNERIKSELTEKEYTLLKMELLKKEKMTFKQIRKKLNLPEEAVINLESEGGELKGHTTYYRLEKAFGKTVWAGFNEEKRYEIWHTLHFADDEKWLTGYARKKWDMNDEQIEKLLKIRFETGYGRYSAKAMKKMIPFLEKGMQEDKAVIEAGYEPAYQKELQRLNMLPPPPDIRNPIVLQSLFELRRLVNAVVSMYGKPDIIRVELAREMKRSRKDRQRIRFENQKKAKRNKDIKEKLVGELGILRPSGNDILKYVLWEECGGICPYTGNVIGLNDLFSPQYEIEHIIPYSRSLDNSYMNKTICHKGVNSEKGNETPYEAFSGSDGRFTEIVTRVSRSRMPYGKKQRFWKREISDDFISRQLNDTRYISRETVKYLKLICEKVQAVSGGTTSLLRRYWGLNTVLGKETKNRDDHRHHAVDALVIACTNQGNVHKLSRYHKYGITLEAMPDPWHNFRNDAVNMTERILVSHRIRRKTSGQLHEETFYGKRFFPGTGERFVIRKPLENLTAKQILNIADSTVRQVIMNRLGELGIDVSKKKFTVPKNAFAEPLYMYRKNEKNPQQRIRKVRVMVNAGNMINLKEGRNLWVEPGNNHHIAIFENEAGKQDGAVVSLFEAAQRALKGEPVVKKEFKPGWQFVMSLSINEMILLNVNKEDIDWEDPEIALRYSENLYRVQKISMTQQIFFRHHITAKLKNDSGVDIGCVSKYPNSLSGIKVIIDSIGKMRIADD